MPIQNHSLAPKDILHFLKQLYFGDYQKDCYRVSSDRAFRDFCRTIREKEYKNIPDEQKDAARTTVAVFIKERIGELGKCNPTQEAFDMWHKETCEGIQKKFKIAKLGYGQTQKWLNMTCKYLLALDNEKVWNSIPYLHVPIDNIVIDLAAKQNLVKRPTKSWSTWNFEEYKAYQEALRKAITDTYPIVWEFRNWNNQ